MKIRPLHDRVVVRRKEQEETTAGGIILTAAAKEKSNQGVVVAVGPGAALSNGETRAMSVKVGDEVLFGPYAGNNTVKDGNDELIIMNESDIYGVVEA